MNPYGNDWQYANSRLQETLVRWGDITFVVDGVSPDCEVIGRSIKDGKDVVAALDDVSCEPFRLGFLNYQGSASYISRLPKRRDWRQGIRYNNVRSLSGIEAQIIPFPYYYDLSQGIYPTLSEAMKSGNKLTAFHYDWAVSSDGSLQYKTTPNVGKVVEGNALLHEEYQWLEEYLKEVLNEV